MSLGSVRRLLLAALVFVSSPAAASSISNVGVSPTSPLAGDFVSLSAQLSYDSTGFSASDVETSAPDPLSFVIDVHVGAPAPEEIVLPVLTSEVVVAGIGNLPAGDYSYVVNLILEPRTTGLMIHADSFSGSFTVAPEPSAPALLGLALAALTLRSQIRAR